MNKVQQITQYLYETDPMNIGTIKNNLYDEYDIEAKMCVDHPDEIKEVFEDCFYEGCMNGKEEIIEGIRRILNE